MKFITYIETDQVAHVWRSDFSKKAERYLDAEMPGRSHMRMGRYSVILSSRRDRLIAGATFDDEIRYKEFSCDRLAQCAEVLKTLWTLKNSGEQHPLHDELKLAIENEAIGWTKREPAYVYNEATKKVDIIRR